MESFQITLANVLVTLFYILPGFIVCKMKKATVEHLPSMSALLVYIGTPFLVVRSFMRLPLSWDVIWNMVYFFLATIITQALFMLLIYVVIRKRVADGKYRVMTIASVMGNVGFFGIPVLTALFPNEPLATCYAAVFMLTMNLLVFTIGVFCLTGEKKYMSLRTAICNPTTFSFLIALPIYLFGLGNYLPEVFQGAISKVGDMTAPLCMFILGIRLASAPLKDIFSQPTVYVTAAMKLLIFPVFCYATVYFLPLSEVFKASILVLSGMPCASVVLSLAEMHKSEMKMSANCILVSTLLSFLTIPLLTLLL